MINTTVVLRTRERQQRFDKIRAKALELAKVAQELEALTQEAIDSDLKFVNAERSTTKGLTDLYKVAYKSIGCLDAVSDFTGRVINYNVEALLDAAE